MPAFEPALSPAEINDLLQMVRFLSREGRDLAWWEKYDALIVAHCSIPWESVLGYDEPPEERKRGRGYPFAGLGVSGIGGHVEAFCGFALSRRMEDQKFGLTRFPVKTKLKHEV
jgi:hypothetical protein